MKNSPIEWTDHTFNPWWGCTHAGSPGCDHCYAQREAKRFGFDCFGPRKPRRTFGEKHWNEPIKWDREAMEARKRAIVLCGSMCDVFDQEGPRIEREDRLWPLTEMTGNIFWLFLTKRSENIGEMMPPLGFPPNVGLGVTVETQKQVWRIEEMLKHEAALYFVSHEPALGNVWWPRSFLTLKNTWLITGGESGPDARPMHPAWARNDRDQCVAAGIPFFFKQWGEWRPATRQDESFPNENYRFIKFDGSIISSNEIFDLAQDAAMYHVGKKSAGRILDGREWNEEPALESTKRVSIRLSERVAGAKAIIFASHNNPRL